MIADRSSFVTTRSGTWNPVAMNSVRGIRVPCEKGAPAEDSPPTRGLAREFMDLTVTRAQYDAVRRRSRGTPPARRSHEGPGRRHAPEGRRPLRPAPHVRRSHGTERAVRLERAYRCGRGSDAGIQGVR